MGHSGAVANGVITLYLEKDESNGLDHALKFFHETGAQCEQTCMTILGGFIRKGDLYGARTLFDRLTIKNQNICNWMMSCYMSFCLFSETFALFRELHLLGIPHDHFTYTHLLVACFKTNSLIRGKAVHGCMLRSGFDLKSRSSLPVQNTLATIYSFCGRLDNAQAIFTSIRHKTNISWNVKLSCYLRFDEINTAFEHLQQMPEKNDATYKIMIAWFNKNSLYEEGIKLFDQMRLDGLIPSNNTYKKVLFGASMLGSLYYGCQLHAQLIQFGHGSSNSTSNALLNMYSKCGSIVDAQSIFRSVPSADILVYTSMIGGLGYHGRGNDVIRLFHKMIVEGIQPDRVCFLTLLSACSHSRMIDEGMRFYDVMKNVYGLALEEEHYVTIIDMMGRAGRIDEAMNVARSMPFEAGLSIWLSILSNCRIHNRLDLAVYAANKVIEMGPKNSANYVLLSHVYSAAGRYGDAVEVRKTMRDIGARKEPGCSWIEVESKVHPFFAGDVRHPEVIMECDSLRRVMVILDTEEVEQLLARLEEED